MRVTIFLVRVTLVCMAKRATTQIVRAFPIPRQAPAPVIRIATPRAPAARKAPKRRGRARGGSPGKTMVSGAIGGAALGFLEKAFPNLPTVPILGRAGTVGLACYFLSQRGGMGNSGILRDIAFASAVLAGYQIGTTGKIQGDVMGEEYDDVSGSLAAQV